MGYAQQNGQKSVVDGYAEAGAIATEVRRALAVFTSAIPLLSSGNPLLSVLGSIGSILAALASSLAVASGVGIHCSLNLAITTLQYH